MDEDKNFSTPRSVRVLFAALLSLSAMFLVVLWAASGDNGLWRDAWQYPPSGQALWATLASVNYFAVFKVIYDLPIIVLLLAPAFVIVLYAQAESLIESPKVSIGFRRGIQLVAGLLTLVALGIARYLRYLANSANCCGKESVFAVYYSGSVVKLLTGK